MTVPSREEAVRLLRSLDPPAWHVRHARAVAEIAGWLALRVERRRQGEEASAGRGHRPESGDPKAPGIDRRLVEAAALLHDVDKAIDGRRGGSVRGSARRSDSAGHGEAGARWLAQRGHPELAEAVSLHPVTLLVEPLGMERVLGASAETRIVAYADKRAGQRLEPMAERFGRWQRRHPASRGGSGWSPEAAGRAWEAARALEAAVCELAGCRPDDVARLRWTAGRPWTPGRRSTAGAPRTPAPPAARLGASSRHAASPGAAGTVR